ncbi:hypothetical protein AAG906_026428 [Vitis piasezkii]
MTTLHGSTPSLRRRVEGCVPPEGMIASARDLLNWDSVFPILVSSESAPRLVRVWSIGELSSIFREIRHRSFAFPRYRHESRVVIIDRSRPPWLLFMSIGSSSTWDDLDSIPWRSIGQVRMPDIEIIVVDVSRRELEGFKQRSDESISSFISRWWGKIVEIVD